MKRLTACTIGLLMAAILTSTAFAEEKKFTAGIWVGSFIPQDWQIQGQQSVSYDATGEATFANVWGFGNGTELFLYGIYYFSDWGLRLECGARLLQKRKLDIDFPTRSEEYENRLNIIPVSLTLLYRIKIPDTKFTPYVGIGPSIYFTSWETKFFRQVVGLPFERIWLKDSSIPIGMHLLAGLEYPIYKGLYIGGEIKYSYVEGSWELEDQDTGEVTEIKGLNIGGTSIRLGLNYRF